VGGSWNDGLALSAAWPFLHCQGRGLACVLTAPLAASIVRAVGRRHADGSVTLCTGSVEIGRGTQTVLAQMVAEELALLLAWGRLVLPEFGMHPSDQATRSSRSTTLIGLALHTAAQDLHASTSFLRIENRGQVLG
jgi:CO/xanthine dehydrogenase Mo-binding subunit